MTGQGVCVTHSVLRQIENLDTTPSLRPVILLEDEDSSMGPADADGGRKRRGNSLRSSRRRWSRHRGEHRPIPHASDRGWNAHVPGVGQCVSSST
jgi:hypothetical protein